MTDTIQEGTSPLLRGISAVRMGLTVLIPLLAVAAPVLTGAHYLFLAAGSAPMARQMMLVTDPVNTALALTIAFFPWLLAVASLVSVLVSGGRFHVALAYGLVFLAVVTSGTNLHWGLWAGLAFVTSVSLLFACLVPPEYPIVMMRYARDRSVPPQFQGSVATWVKRHRALDRAVVTGAAGSFVVVGVAVVVLGIGLLVAQFARPTEFELTFEGVAEPTTTVWFSTSDSGTWYLTNSATGDGDPGSVLGARQLEWASSTPIAIVPCGLSSAVCDGSGSD